MSEELARLEDAVKRLVGAATLIATEDGRLDRDFHHVDTVTICLELDPHKEVHVSFQEAILRALKVESGETLGPGMA